MERSSAHQTSKDVCIIHKLSLDIKPDEPLIHPQTLDSWKTLLDAAKVRGHDPILELAESLADDEIPPTVLYHRKCRAVFTMRRDLEVLKRKADSGPTADADTTSSSSKRHARRSSSESRILDQECIFCGSIKYSKGANSREKLSKSIDLRADQTLRQCATQKCDTKIMAITSRDIVAAEARYHFSCYRNYTRPTTPDVPPSDADRTSQDIVQEQSYEELLDFIRYKIIPRKEIIAMTTLAEHLSEIMKSKGLDEMSIAMKKNLRRKLESELGNSIKIFHDHSGKLIVVPDCITLEDAVREIQSLRQELNTWRGKSSNISKVLDQASSHMRTMIKNDKTPSPWPCHPVDTEKETFVIPEYLQRFMLGLLTGDPENRQPSNRVGTLMQSFSQDIVYAVTCGQQKPPKHLLLPYTVKTLTGNVELIRTLNRLGHGISYTQLEENDTALCLQKLAATNEQPILPASIQPYVFTNLAWDNIDRLEETLTGKGTTHRVNGIAVQAKVYGPQLPTVPLPKIDKQHQRTVYIPSQELPVYIAGERVGPHSLQTVSAASEECDKAVKVSRNKNLLWTIARLSHSVSQKIPSWTGFNITLRASIKVSRDVVGYMPTINAPATEMSTVSEILKQSESVRQMLHLQNIVVVMDQALYAKAAEIVWKHADIYDHILLRLGTFHTICNVMSILGARFQDAGLRDLCIEGGIIAEGSVTRVMDGKMYNRAIRVHKTIYEAFMRLAWMEFIPWLEKMQADKMQVVTQFLAEVTESGQDEGQWNVLLEDQSFIEVQTLWEQFLDHLRHENGDLSYFWMSYVDIVETILLSLLRAAREGNWQLHLSAVEAMLPWCFAYDKINYARYMSAYYAQMSNLPVNYPDVFQAFSDGYFSVQLSNSNPFGRIPVDQTTEVTVNKDTQTPGGTTRFGLKPGAVKRYYITSEHRSAFLGQMREMVNGNQSEVQHVDLQQTRIKKDDADVSTVVNLIQSWVNPFTMATGLISISTARIAPQDITTDLKRAQEVGDRCYTSFKAERLESDPPKTKFHDPLKLNKLKTFSNLNKKKAVTSNGRSVILQADRALFGRIIVMAQGRDIQMADVLAHPLGPLPWALATPEGLLRKTNKAALATALQRNVAPAEKMPDNSATIIDGMLLIQKVVGDQANFGEIAMFILSMALKDGSMSQRIDIVFDIYKETSIKNGERLARGEELGLELKNIAASQIVRQWRKFLSNVGNKSSLISFLVEEWKKPEYTTRLQGKILLVTCGDKCYQITSNSSEEIAALQSTHEEADGRLFLHVAHAATEGYESVLIHSDDTDVFVMSLAFQNDIQTKLFQKCGTKARTKVLDIEKIGKSVGRNICQALIGMHAFTGCDTVSTFAGKGKLSALKLVRTNADVYDACVQLGEEWEVSPQLMDKLESFTCLLYAAKSGTTKVNDLRYHLFCAKKSQVESHQLPPCRDCLNKHAQRANYQAAIWKRSLQKDPAVPSPIGRGWRWDIHDGRSQLAVDWMDGQPAPQAVLDLLACTCSKVCKLPKCVCMASGLKCTEMCKLSTCGNQRVNPYDQDDPFDEEEDEDDDEDY